MTMDPVMTEHKHTALNSEPASPDNLKASAFADQEKEIELQKTQLMNNQTLTHDAGLDDAEQATKNKKTK